MYFGHWTNPALSPKLHPMLGRPDAVVFDFGGTLVDDHFDVSAGQRRMLELAKPASVDPATYARMAAEIDGDITPRKLDSLIEHAATTFTQLVSDCTGIELSGDSGTLELEFWLASERCELVEGAAEVVRRLRRENVRLGIISNMTFSSAVIHHELNRMGLRDSFAAIVTSADYGIRKPHPLVFRGMVGRLHVKPGRCWYVGDRIDLDVAGAQGAGLKAIWLNRKGESAPSTIVPARSLPFRPMYGSINNGSLIELVEFVGPERNGAIG